MHPESPQSDSEDVLRESLVGIEKSLDSISIAQIRALLAFEEARSVTGAARKLGREQSTVSRQLSALGSVLPFSITRRFGKDTVPTNRAVEFAKRLRSLLSQAESFISENSDRALVVRFGCGATSLHSLIVPNIEHLRNLFVESGPEPSRLCRLHLGNLRSHQTVTRLREGRIDFGIVRETALEEARSLDSRFIGKSSYCVVMASRFATNVHSLKDIVTQGIPVVTLSGNGEFKRELRSRLEDSNVSLNLTDELDFFADVVMAVRCNPIAGIVPSTALSHEPDEEHFRSFALPFFGEDLERGRSSYVREFVLVWNPKAALEKFAPKIADFDKSAWLQTRIIEPMANLFSKTLNRATAKLSI